MSKSQGELLIQERLRRMMVITPWLVPCLANHAAGDQFAVRHRPLVPSTALPVPQPRHRFSELAINRIGNVSTNVLSVGWARHFRWMGWLYYAMPRGVA